MKTITVCADDFAMGECTSQAIVELIKLGRVTATSCMTTTARWPLDAPTLKPFIGHVDIGLHLNFTERLRDGNDFLLPLHKLITQSYLKLLPKDKVRESIETQCQLFVDHMGCFPDFIDGHQHVHQFPVIRNELFRFVTSKHKEKQIYIRNTVTHQSLFHLTLKSIILRLLGGNRLGVKLKQYGISTNHDFLGTYDFSEMRYRELMRDWLKNCSPGSLIMCHPAIKKTEGIDHTLARLREYRYLSSLFFEKDLAEADVKLERFSTQMNHS